MRALVLLLLLALPGLAPANDDLAAVKRVEIRQLEEKRDAALIRAYTYALPKDRLEAEEAQRRIDALEKELAALEQAGR